MAQKTQKRPSRSEQGKETRQTLIETGARLFAQNGFNAVSMRTLAAEANVNLATISYHFGGKAGLYSAIMQEAIEVRDEMFPATDEVQARMDQAGDEIDARARVVDWFIGGLLRNFVANKEYVWAVVIITRELVYPSAIYPKLEQEFFDPSFNSLCKLVERILPSGSREDVVLSTQAIIGIIINLIDGHNIISKRMGWISYDGHLDAIAIIIKKRIRGLLGLPMENA